MVSILEQSHDNFIAVEVHGVVTKEELLGLAKPFEEAIEKYGTVHWMCVWNSFEYGSVGAFYEDMKWVFKHIRKFGRMAIVGNAWWKKLLVEADSLIFGEKYFDISRKDEAWKYVEGK